MFLKNSPLHTTEVELETLYKKYRREISDRDVIFLGAGTCGLAAGAGKTLKAIKKYLQDKALEDRVEVVEVGCIGACFAEPMVDIKLQGRRRLSFQQVTEEKVADILDALFTKNNIAPVLKHIFGQFEDEHALPWENLPSVSEHPFFKKQRRFVLDQCGVINPVSIEEYIAHGGYQAFLRTIHTITPSNICDMVEKSGLRGRGGGGFPTGKKWKLALANSADQKYIICNADEGDPGAFMDRAVIEGDPHKLLEGLLIGAYAIGASKAYIYIRAEYPLAVKNLTQAINDAKKYKLLGENIYGSGLDLDVIIKMGAGAFVCGEETALIHSIEGKRGMPRPRPPYPAASGLFKKPTIINNVETFANIPLIISRGHEFFSAIGTSNSKGTKVFALSGKIKRTGLVEIPMGTTLREIVFEIGGGIEHDYKFKAVQIGGPSGGCIPEEKLDIEIDYESLKAVGAMMGSGGLVVMDEHTCMVDVAKFFMDFIQRESCGKCIPCREGTKSMLEILKAITQNRKHEKENETLVRFQGIMNFERLAQVIKDTSLCGLGQTAPNPILSTLRWFRDEYEAHIYDRKCPAGACQELLSYSIDKEKCKGCTLCMKVCAVNAISGERKQAHSIDQEKCILCGACFRSCKFAAIKVS
ncbi:MAG: NADH-quinone oxidoreductase subunit NuoF [Oligoflexia bacterium]|nr:NADH-quinone oxidoreductase subunit NuoF [Oligoflexia bacterium]MBF0366466.1 NADH-quinone oxidoreductase subunit NuoF [Oligoflexia bacterium]